MRWSAPTASGAQRDVISRGSVVLRYLKLKRTIAYYDFSPAVGSLVEDNEGGVCLMLEWTGRTVLIPFGCVRIDDIDRAIKDILADRLPIDLVIARTPATYSLRLKKWKDKEKMILKGRWLEDDMWNLYMSCGFGSVSLTTLQKLSSDLKAQKKRFYG